MEGCKIKTEVKNLEGEILEGDIVFNTSQKKEILKLASNGDIFVKGKLIENDKEVVDALREFIKISSQERIQ